jgi:hypothetical protein
MQNLEGWQNSLLGAIAGPMAMPCSQMFIYWKNTYAILGQPFSMNPRHWYRGLPVSMLLQGPVNGTQFFGTGLAKQAMGGKAQEGKDSTLSDMQIIAAGMCGGMLSGFVCAPQECLMVQQQKLGGSLQECAGRVVREHGPMRLMRALPATCLREGAYTVGFLSLAPIFTQKMRDRPGYTGTASDELRARVTGAICGGLTGAFISHPVDFIKTQQQGDVAMGKVRGLFHTGKVLYKELGFCAFYRGLPWRSCGICMNAFMINFWKDTLAPVVFPSQFL